MTNPAMAFEASYVLLWIVVIIQSVLLVGLVRVVYTLHQEVPAQPLKPRRLSRGAEAPALAATALSGASVSNADFLGHMTALLFVSPHCPSCAATLYEMQALELKTKGNVVVVCRGTTKQALELAQAHELAAPVIADSDDQITRSFGVVSVPTAVLIDAENRIHSYGEPLREHELEELMEAAIPRAGSTAEAQ
jgi:methylamine dehydrogenase accessory protein MauD